MPNRAAAIAAQHRTELLADPAAVPDHVRAALLAKDVSPKEVRAKVASSDGR